MNIQLIINHFAKLSRVLLAFTLAILPDSCTCMKMNPSPDTDKAFLAANNSCYFAAAA